MSVRRRNKKLQQESKIKYIPTYNDRGEFVGFREELKEPAGFAADYFDKGQPLKPGATTMDKSQEIIALERERLVRVSQEHKKVDYVLRMKRYGFKMGKAHKA